MNWYDAQDWLDLVDHAWYGLVLIAVAGVPAWIAARNHKAIRQVKDQVVNGHTTPMRADMDLMRDDITGMRDEMRGGFASMRDDIAEERAARRDADASIRDEIRRHHPG